MRCAICLETILIGDAYVASLHSRAHEACTRLREKILPVYVVGAESGERKLHGYERAEIFVLHRAAPGQAPEGYKSLRVNRN
jgi:hypothetical protein